jgi:hypothetical protein
MEIMMSICERQAKINPVSHISSPRKSEDAKYEKGAVFLLINRALYAVKVAFSKPYAASGIGVLPQKGTDRKIVKTTHSFLKAISCLFSAFSLRRSGLSCRSNLQDKSSMRLNRSVTNPSRVKSTLYIGSVRATEEGDAFLARGQATNLTRFQRIKKAFNEKFPKSKLPPMYLVGLAPFPGMTTSLIFPQST